MTVCVSWCSCYFAEHKSVLTSDTSDDLRPVYSVLQRYQSKTSALIFNSYRLCVSVKSIANYSHTSKVEQSSL